MLGKFNRLFARLKSDVSGNLLLMAGAGMTALVGAAGVGVDTVQWYLWKRQMQQAVDTGAFSGALSLAQGDAWEAPARAEVGRTANTTYTIEAARNPPTTGDFTADPNAIEIIATTQRALPFSSVFLSTPPTIRTRAVATVVIGTAEHCVISLAQNGTGVEVFGSAQVNLGCGVAANSPSGISVDLGGSSYLDADPVSSVGGIDYSSSNVPADTSLVSYGLPVEDPLASRNLSAPTTPAACDYNNFNVTPSQTVTRLDPGRFCNGFRIQGTVTLKGGVYIIDRGDFRINSGASITMAPGSKGATFILTGSSSSNVAQVTINGSATVDLRAPTSTEDSVWQDILFYQDDLGQGTTHTINGGSGINMEGVIYMPTGDLTYNGDSTQTATCLLMITERVRFGGTNNIDNNCSNEYDDIDTRPRLIRVVE